jgi:chromosome segregation ATPase
MRTTAPVKAEISLLEHRLSSMESQLDDMKIDLKSVSHNTEKLIDSIIGNSLTQSDGLVAKYKEIKSKVNEHEELVKKLKWFWLGVFTLGSLVAIIIQIILKLLFGL